MATPPVQSGGPYIPTGNFSAFTATKTTTASLTMSVGDLITVIATGEDGDSITLANPTLSAGAATWTSAWTPIVGAGNSLCYGWSGVVTTAGTGTLSITATAAFSPWWGFSARLWTSHGGVGLAARLTSSTVAPSLAVTCSANSAIVAGFNDWTAKDATTRTWRTINGAPMTESAYFRDAAHHSAFAGLSADTGAAGSITTGLSAPTGTWKVVGGAIEVLGTSGGGGGSTSVYHPRNTFSRVPQIRASTF